MEMLKETGTRKVPFNSDEDHVCLLPTPSTYKLITCKTQSSWSGTQAARVSE